MVWKGLTRTVSSVAFQSAYTYRENWFGENLLNAYSVHEDILCLFLWLVYKPHFHSELFDSCRLMVEQLKMNGNLLLGRGYLRQRCPVFCVSHIKRSFF